MSQTTQYHGIAPLDRRLAEGKETVASAELRGELEISAQATSNLLARWQRAGLVDRVARGRYAIRQIGLLGTRASSEDVALAVSAFVGDRPHRIAYHSALDFHGLLTRPVRTVHLASSSRFSSNRVGDLPLKVVREPRATVALGSESAGHGAMVSNVERTLLDAASRTDLIGGYLPLAEVLVAAQPDRDQLVELAGDLDASAALRRIGSLADKLEVPGLANELEPLGPLTFDLDLDPSLKHAGTAFRDRKWRIRWPIQAVEGIQEINR